MTRHHVRFLTIVLGLSVAMLIVAQPASPETLRLGDPAPPLPILGWIRGDAQAARLAPGETVVLEFWATWCPSSRAFLSRQDSLLAAAPQPGLRIVAVAPEQSVHVSAFVAKAGWSRLAIACDPAKRAFQTFADSATRLDRESRFLPFAFVIRPDAETPEGRIVWMGQPVDPLATQPLAVFDSVLAAVCAGTFDLEGAIEIARQEERSLALFQELFASDRNNDLDQLEALLAELPNLHLAPGYRNTLVTNMNGLAWSLATRETGTPRHVAIARMACAIALAAGGGDEPYFVDTYARVLYESGEVAQAVEQQTRAVELARELPWIDEARANLARYREAAGLPPAEDAVAAAAQAGAPGHAPAPPGVDAPRVWQGNLNSALTQFDRAAMALLVGPGAQEDPARDADWTTELTSTHEQFYSDAPMTRADEVSAREQREKILVLYGTPDANEITREALALHGIAIDSTGIAVGRTRLSLEHPVLITCLPNPWNPALPLKIYTAAREEDARGLNRFFHGPTAFMCGQWQDTRPVVRYALDYEPFAIQDTDLPEADFFMPPLAPARLALAPESLTSEQARADLRALHALLEEEYAGYQDLDWELRASGGSWGARTREFEARIIRRPSWAWQEYFDLLREYLDPVQDAHFSMTGSAVVNGETATPRAGFIRMLEPYFADVVIQSHGDRYLVAPTDATGTPTGATGSATLAAGMEIIGVEPVATPHAVAVGQVHLFPTLPSQPADLDAPETDTYLLGTFALRGSDPDSLTVHVRQVGGTQSELYMRQARLPVHRGRLGAPLGSRENWKLSGPPEIPLPALAVRTMNERLLPGMTATADSLRAHPRVVLDLRWNPGGSDSPAIEWCRRFSDQPYEWIAAAFRPPNSHPGPFGWVSRMGGPLSAGDPAVPLAPFPYAGRLFVLTGKGAASSGETFTHLAGQIRGAIIVGQNTAGCVTYGNVREWEPLAHSRIKVGFGVTKFVEDWVRPNHEGVGFFPDYWLDTDDPITALASYREM